MSVKEYLSFEFKKFVVPIILIIIFLFAIGTFYVNGKTNDEYMCKILSISANSKFLINTTATKNGVNYSEALESLIGTPEMKEYQTVADKFMKERKSKMLSYPGFRSLDPLEKLFVVPFYNVLFNINPFIPVPCEELRNGYSGKSYICKFYISEETYDCIKEAVPGTNLLPYSKSFMMNLVYILLNVGVLIIEGYLFSAAILFLYRYFR